MIIPVGKSGFSRQSEQSEPASSPIADIIGGSKPSCSSTFESGV